FPNPDGDPPTTAGVGFDGQSIPLLEPASDEWSPGDSSWSVAHRDYASGLMNGFQQGAHQPERSGLGAIFGLDFNRAFFGASGTNAAYVSYGRDVETGQRRLFYYWWLAAQGVLCDRFFSSELGESLQNTLYLLAATSGGCIGNPDPIGPFPVLVDPQTGYV